MENQPLTFDDWITIVHNEFRKHNMPIGAGDATYDTLEAYNEGSSPLDYVAYVICIESDKEYY